MLLIKSIILPNFSQKKSGIMIFCKNSVFAKFKGQLISKKIVKPRILQKNERMNSFLLVCDVFSFAFWKNPWPRKKRFEII